MTGSLDEFPFSIFGCSSEREFYNTVLPFVIPLCLQEVELANLNKIASILGANPKELLQVQLIILNITKHIVKYIP